MVVFIIGIILGIIVFVGVAATFIYLIKFPKNLNALPKPIYYTTIILVILGFVAIGLIIFGALSK